MLAIARLKLTGVTTNEYLVHRTPVAKMASCWYGEIFSAGLLKSPMLEKVIIHLKVGAQKKTKRQTTALVYLKMPSFATYS